MTSKSSDRSEHSSEARKIVILGGGLAGLTCAQRLIDEGYDVELYEISDRFGGFTSGKRDHDGTPVIHSWRGFFSSYGNIFKLLKRLRMNIFHEKPVALYNLRDFKDQDSNLIPKISGYIKFSFWMIAYHLSSHMKDVSYKTPILDIMTHEEVKTFLPYLSLLCTISGYNPKHSSIGMCIEGFKSLQSGIRVYVVKAPVNEIWIDPWVSKLKNQGVKMHLNVGLETFNFDGNSVKSAVLTNGEVVSGNIFISCMDPYSAEKISRKFPVDDVFDLRKLIDEDCFKNNGIPNSSGDLQISYTISFSRKLQYKFPDTAFNLTDSEFNISFIPNDNFYGENFYFGDGVKSFLSGTACNMDTKGRLFKKQAKYLSEQELKKEILFQIFRSEDLEKIYYGDKIKRSDILHIKLGDEWKFISKNGENYVKPLRNKFGDCLNMTKNKPSQITDSMNLFQCGAHTLTHYGNFSMESAVQSANMVCDILTKNSETVVSDENSDSNIFGIIFMIVVFLSFLTFFG